MAWLQLLPALLGTTAAYFLVNRALVSIAVSWSSGQAFWRVMWDETVMRERLFDSLAPFILFAPVVVCFEAVGYLGLLLFYAPLRIIYESSLRYVELRNAQKLLIHSERMAAKGEMAAEIGHELRNQLVAISGRAQMLIRDSEREQFASVGRHSQIILEQARRVEAMSKGLMDFARAELKVEKVDLNALVQRSVEFVRPQNRFDSIEWDLRLAGQMPTLQADPGQLQQVMLNLYINAADAMQENSGRRVIETRTEFLERRRLVRMIISDSGPGIPSALLAKVFEPHFTTKAEGHGFGLYASYRIVTNHGGQIVAESEAGQGARFTVTLPLDGPSGWG
jgi:signal transduction histidine kinase